MARWAIEPPLPLGRQRAVRDLRATAGQRAGLGEHNRFGIVLADPADPLDALDQGHRAQQLGAVIRGGFGGLHGVDPVIEQASILASRLPERHNKLLAAYLYIYRVFVKAGGRQQWADVCHASQKS